MHGQWGVGMGTAAHARACAMRLVGREILRRLPLQNLSMLRLVLSLQLGLEILQGWTIHIGIGKLAGLKGAATEAATGIIVARANDLTAAYNDTPVTVVHRRLGGLLQAKGEIVVRSGGHC